MGRDGSTDDSTGGSTGNGFPLSKGAWPALEFIKMEGELLPTEPEAFDCELGGLGGGGALCACCGMGDAHCRSLRLTTVRSERGCATCRGACCGGFESARGRCQGRCSGVGDAFGAQGRLNLDMQWGCLEVSAPSLESPSSSYPGWRLTLAPPHPPRFPLPWPPAVVISSLGLHWFNDLPVRSIDPAPYSCCRPAWPPHKLEIST